MAAIRTLTATERLFLPLIKRTAKADKLSALERRERYTVSKILYEKTERKIEKKLTDDAKIFGQQLVQCWTRRRAAFMAKHAHIATDGKPIKQTAAEKRRYKIKHVQFARIRMFEEQIWFQIYVSKRWFFQYKDMLPFGVDVADLISKEALFELSVATQRKVEAWHDDYTRGVWIVVNRLEGVDGMPLHVKFADVLPAYAGKNLYPDKGPIVLGSGPNKTLHHVHLSEVHHIMIAGESGGGKSNALKLIISGLIRFCDPSQVRLILIDPKRLELGKYYDVPHLDRPVVFDAAKAVGIFEELLKEINARTRLFFNRADNLTEWNERYPDRALHRIVVIVDELAQLMIMNGKDIGRETEDLLASISNLGRALGVHLILATQFPIASVIPNRIKLNMGLTIGARTSNMDQSRVIVDTGDLAKLPKVLGRMYIKHGPDRFVVQTPHVIREDVDEAKAVAKGRALGLIRLEGHEPVINADNVICYIVDVYNGHLSVDSLARLAAFAVPATELKYMLRDVVRKGCVNAAGRYFEVEQHGKNWRLVEVREVRAELPALPTWPTIYLPAVAGALPEAPAPAAPLPAAQVAPVAQDEEASRDYDPVEVVTEFIRERCIVSKTSKVKAKDLYASYKQYCESLDEIPLAINMLGMELGKLKFVSKRGTGGVRQWLGITLNPAVGGVQNDDSDSPQEHSPAA